MWSFCILFILWCDLDCWDLCFWMLLLIGDNPHYSWIRAFIEYQHTNLLRFLHLLQNRSGFWVKEVICRYFQNYESQEWFHALPMDKEVDSTPITQSLFFYSPDIHTGTKVDLASSLLHFNQSLMLSSISGPLPSYYHSPFPILKRFNHSNHPNWSILRNW